MGHFELKLASPWPRVVSVIALPSRTAHPPLTISIKFKTKSQLREVQSTPARSLQN